MSRTRKNWGFPKWGDYGQDRDAVTVRMCDYQGCDSLGEHRAPKSPFSDEKWFFCAHHAAEYNRNWNFFTGMTDAEAQAFAEEETRTAEGYSQANTWSWGGAMDEDGVSKVERDAYAVLELEPDATDAELKAQYRKLAKRHHPDANAGSKESEHLFRKVCAAYALLQEKSEKYR